MFELGLKRITALIILSIYPLSLSQGLGTDEDTLIEILASRTNRQILDLKKAYKEGTCQIHLSNNFHFRHASVWKYEQHIWNLARFKKWACSKESFQI